MSYILDALKKATTEREHLRGSIPHLNAQPVRAGQPHEPSSDAASRKGWLIAAAVLLVVSVLAAVAWRLTAPPGSAPAAQLVADADRPARSPSPMAAQSAPAATPAPLPATPATAVMPPPLASPPPKADDTAPAVRADRPQRGPAVPAQPPALPPPPAVAPPREPATALLPLPDTAPKLVVSGATYSESPAYRMLIVNGQVYREGESPAAGVKIQKIGPRAAVVQHDGKSFSLKY